ncbi:ribonuclease Z [Candidatus Woesearchaeota archaeon]|nr:ribonuclease Z [Candidatus Woesearchaeota archaeon]
MQVTFLGTSSMVPTKKRNHTSVLISYGANGILLDCGEGTQRQLKIAGIKPTQVTKVLISHWHGDHVLGLPGLIQTLGASEYNRTLEIYGPKGTKQHFEDMFKAFVFDKRIEISIKEVGSGVFFKGKEFSLEALPLEHNIETLGYNFIENDKRRIDVKAVKKLGIPECPLLGKLQDNKSIEFKGKKISPKDTTYVVKGKKITFIADTVYCNNAVKLADNADLLICEATYSSKLEGKANEYGHLTAKQAGLIANEANAKKLVLTHFSARYKNTQEVEEDARSVFDNVICAEDFMKVRL